MPILPTDETDIMLTPDQTLVAERRGNQSFGNDLSNFKRDQSPSNFPGAKNPDGFSSSSSTTALADEGFQILEPAKGEVSVSDNPTTPELENDHWRGSASKQGEGYVRDDKENSFDIDGDSSNDPEGEIDWNNLQERADQAGVRIADFLDPQDLHSPDAGLLAEMLIREIENAEALKLYDDKLDIIVPEAGKDYNIELRADKIKTHAVRTALEKQLEKNLNVLNEIWQEARTVDVLIDPKGGPAMIAIRPQINRSNQSKATPSKFIFMSLEDFSRTLSVPEVNNGESMLVVPDIRSNNPSERFKLISFFERIKVNGQYIGGDEVPNFSISIRHQNTDNQDIERGTSNFSTFPEQRLWHPAPEED